jgi:hypothetical protein
MSDTIAATLSGRPAQEIDMHKTLSTASLEFIGQGGLGHSFAASKSGAATLDGMQQLLYAVFDYCQRLELKFGLDSQQGT